MLTANELGQDIKRLLSINARSPTDQAELELAQAQLKALLASRNEINP